MIAAIISAGLLFQTLPPTVAEHAQAAMEARQNGHLREAIEEFRKVTELAPDLDAGFLNLGAVLLENRQYSEAIAPLEKALRLNPVAPGGDRMLGYALLSAGYVEQALPHLEKAGDPGALGIAQVRLGHFSEATRNLTLALAQRPNDPNLLYYLGRASGLLSKQAFDSLESSFPDSAQAHQSLGENYAALQRFPEAEKEYQAAVKLRPDLPDLHLAIGELYLSVPDLEKAEAAFREEARLQPGDAETAFHLGDTLLKEGKVKEACGELRRADQLRPNMPETLYVLGKAESLAADTDDAVQTWQHLLQLEPSSPLAAQAHFGLAAIYRKQGKQTEAAHEMSEYESLKQHGPPK